MLLHQALFDMTTYRLANIYLSFLYYRHLASWPRWPSLLTLSAFWKCTVFLGERETTNQQTPQQQDQRMRNLILMELNEACSCFHQQTAVVFKSFFPFWQNFFYTWEMFFYPQQKKILIFPFQSVTNWHVGPVLNCFYFFTRVLISQLK